MGLVIKAYIKKILFTFFILIASAILGSSLLSLVYCLPTDKITQHVASGVQTFLTEGATFEYASGYKSAILDNVTDAIMLGEAVFPSTNTPVSQHPDTSTLTVPLLNYP